MKIKKIAKLALPMLLSGFITFAQAQTDQTNHPFSWKETTDSWYMPQAYSFKYSADDAATMSNKGQTNAVGHGPVYSNECRETTEPGACTENLMKEKFGNVVLPGIALPEGYSGVEYVTFEVQSNGKINNYQVVKQPVSCKPCVQKAVNLVASLGNDWHPAIQNGVYVKSTVVVPVHFKSSTSVNDDDQ